LGIIEEKPLYRLFLAVNQFDDDDDGFFDDETDADDEKEPNISLCREEA